MQLFTGVMVQASTVNTTGAYNAASPLVTPTYDGSGQSVHPDVIDFGGSPFNGFRYWMVMTPYPAADSLKENPSILQSSDGLTWTVPDGLTNPLVTPPSGSDFYSDPDMVYVDGTIYLFYRFKSTAFGGTEFLMRTSTDGVTWSSESTFATNGSSGGLHKSPALIYDGTWKMWSATITGNVRYNTSETPTGFGEILPGATCTITGLPDADDFVWHIDVRKHGSTYYMLINTQTSGGGGKLYFAASSDGLAWTADTTPFLSESASGWDNERQYRGSFVIDGDVLKVWYSAVSTSNAWRIGYTEASASILPTP